MKSLKESLFDDNIKSDVIINGITIDSKTWSQCIKYYDKRRKSGFNKSIVKLGDMEDKYNVVYNESDCIICAGRDDDCVYILCPETIYMNHIAFKILKHSYVFSSLDDNNANDFDIGFSWSDGTWDVFGPFWEREEKLKSIGFINVCGYIPETISIKAMNIIKKLIRR